MKKTISRVLSALTAITMLFCSSVLQASAGSAAGVPYPLDGLDPEDSPIKPTLSLSQITLTLEEAKANPVQTIELTVEGAEEKYCATGIHIDCDSRLEIIPYSPFRVAKEGPAAEYLETYTSFQNLSYDDDKTGIVLITAQIDDWGLDGVLWSFDLTIPDDVQAGDVYPIEIALYDSWPSMFTNREDDEEGKLMQAWVFTNGIEQGYIKIVDDEEGASTTTESQSKERGDANLDGRVTVADAVAILQHIGNRDKYGLSPQGLKNADVDGTEGVTPNDALTIQIWDSQGKI